jgi:endonuclease III
MRTASPKTGIPVFYGEIHIKQNIDYFIMAYNNEGMITNKNIDGILRTVQNTVKAYDIPVLEKFNELTRDPYWVLISCILSLRAKDETTEKVAKALYAAAPSPEKVLKIPVKKMEKIVYRSGFYKVKARNVLNITRTILEKYKGRVPDEIDELMTIKGVGRKTANLVVTVAFNKPGICVDTHVHKISNRWGYVRTKTPDETEMKLREILPQKYWMKINMWLVLFGQNVCLSVSPWCSKCPLEKQCPKVGVEKHR